MHNEETPAIGVAAPVDHEGPEVKSQTLTKGIDMPIVTDSPENRITEREIAQLEVVRANVSPADTLVEHHLAGEGFPELYAIRFSNGHNSTFIEVTPSTGAVEVSGYVRANQKAETAAEFAVTANLFARASVVAQILDAEENKIRVLAAISTWVPIVHADSDGILVDPKEYVAKLKRDAVEFEDGVGAILDALESSGAATLGELFAKRGA